MIAKRILPILILSWLTNLTAQTQTQSPSSSGGTGKPEGWENGGYIIHQSVEVGYRLSDVTGSQQMYDTLVNQQEGPRFLEQTLSMQSENHEGLLFDNLFIESFGWGGDPENALRARVDKSKWYDFRGSFRRDQNNFDYNLLANPINPPTSSPSIPALSSRTLSRRRGGWATSI